MGIQYKFVKSQVNMMGYKKTFVHNNPYPRCIKIWGEFQSQVIMSNHTI
jgi:hypothetical protein